MKLEDIPSFVETLKTLSGKAAFKEGVILADMIKDDQLQDLKKLSIGVALPLKQAILQEWTRSIQASMFEASRIDINERSLIGQLVIETKKAGLT